jgi:hypothetical protein
VDLSPLIQYGQSHPAEVLVDELLVLLGDRLEMIGTAALGHERQEIAGEL